MLVNVRQAKDQLCRLLDRVVAGEEVVIARHGRPEEIANIAAFLASDAAAYVGGRAIRRRRRPDAVPGERERSLGEAPAGF